MPRFNKEKEAARKEELDRQAAEEVARLTQRGGPPGAMGGMGGIANTGQVGMMSPLERIAAEVRDAPRPSMRQQQAPRRQAPAQQAFVAMPTGSVGSSFGPGGLNPGPRTGITAPPPPAFGGGAYEEDYGGHVIGPPVYNAGEYDEEEEMSITEMALMDHAARTGHNPEDLVMQYDASSAEQMRDAAMRQFYERQQSRAASQQTNNPFAPAGMRRGPAGPAGGSIAARRDDPATAGGALAQRIANKRRREEELARRAQGESAPPAAPAARAATPSAKAAPSPAADVPDGGPPEGALSRVLARRRQALGIDTAAPEAPPAAPAAPGRRHAEQREATSPGMRTIPLDPRIERAPSLEEMAAAVPTRNPTKKAPAKKAPAKAAPKAPATKKAPAAKAAPAVKTAAKAPAAKAAKAPAAKTAAKGIFCIECGEKNPAVAKFCFNCGTRLAAPGG